MWGQPAALDAALSLEPLIGRVHVLLQRVAGLVHCEGLDAIAVLEPNEACGLLCAGALEQLGEEVQASEPRRWLDILSLRRTS